MLICHVVTPVGAHYLGYIGCPVIAPLAPYSWARPDDHAWMPVVTIHDYARWSESAFALLARMLERLPQSERRWPAASELTCRLLLGSSPRHSRQIEQLTVTVRAPHVSVELRDNYHVHTASTPARPSYEGLVDVLIHAARVAVWGVDAEPPLRPPLTSVPTHRTDGGLAYVLEADLPTHARRHFAARQRHVHNPALPAGAHVATDWLRFVGG